MLPTSQHTQAVMPPASQHAEAMSLASLAATGNCETTSPQSTVTEDLTIDEQSAVVDLPRCTFADSVVSLLSTAVDTVSTENSSLLVNNVSQPCRSDEHLTDDIIAAEVHELDETVTGTLVDGEVNAIQHMNAANDNSDACKFDNIDSSLQQSRSSEVICDEDVSNENVCSADLSVQPSELLPESASNTDASLQPSTTTVAGAESDDADRVQTPEVCEHFAAMMEPIMSDQQQTLTNSATPEQCSENAGNTVSLEDLDGVETFVDASDSVQMEEEYVLAEQSIQSTAVDTELDNEVQLTSTRPDHTASSHQRTDMVACESDINSDASTHGGPLVSQLQSECIQTGIDSGNLEEVADESSCDSVEQNICSAELPSMTAKSYTDMQSSSLHNFTAAGVPSQASTTTSSIDYHWPAVDRDQIRMPSLSESDLLRDRDSTAFGDVDSTLSLADRWQPVDFTLGESALTNANTGILRRCSLDVPGSRGLNLLSRIAEESTAPGLEHILDTSQHDQQNIQQQYAANGE